MHNRNYKLSNNQINLRPGLYLVCTRRCGVEWQLNPVLWSGNFLAVWPGLHRAWGFWVVSVLWEITIYTFCSAYEHKIEWIVIFRKMDMVWVLCALCGSGSVSWLRFGDCWLEVLGSVVVQLCAVECAPGVD